ncbi:MAG TPA: radical SAM protein [Atribacterota bacterium]|nr:radical SAM protein [Atribacterota bacterium]
MKYILNPYKILNHVPVLNEMIKDNKTPPMAVEIDLTNLCNHNCIWCMFDRYRAKNPVSLEKDLVFNLLQDLKAIGVKAITYVGGGEPLLYPHFKEVLYKTKELGFDCGVVTNGELLIENIQAIKDCCQFCRVSLDAGSSADHKALHRGRWNSFKRVLQGIEALGKEKGDLILGVAFLLHTINFYKLTELVKILSILKVDYLQVRPVYMPGLVFTDRVKQKINIQIDEAQKMAHTTGLHLITFKHRFREFYEEDLRPEKCLAHNILSIIGADSNVYLCCQLRGNPKFSIGNLKEKSFKDIWESDQRQEVIDRIDLSRCPPCRYKKYNEIMEYLSSERRHANFL